MTQFKNIIMPKILSKRNAELVNPKNLSQIEMIHGQMMIILLVDLITEKNLLFKIENIMNAANTIILIKKVVSITIRKIIENQKNIIVEIATIKVIIQADIIMKSIVKIRENYTKKVFTQMKP